MGYFNIFYKITRIIDMLTRKRNRKFIFILIIIICCFFLFSTKVRADFSATIDSPNLQQINNRVGNINSEVMAMRSSVNQYLLAIFSEVDGSHSDLDSIMGYTSFLPTISSNLSAAKDELTNIKATLDSVEDISQDILDDFNTLNTQVDDLLDKTDTLIIELNNIYDKLVEINTNTMHYGNLAHDDAEELKDMLREYLYGDEGQFPISFKTMSNATIYGNGVVSLTDNTSNFIYYIPLKEGYDYDLNWTYYRISGYNYPRIGFLNNIPQIGNTASNLDMSFEANEVTSFTYHADGSYKYLLFSTNTYYVRNFSITSTYNEGQEIGIYGGLTNVDQQVQQQGEMTRDTITSTDYNQSDVNINTDSVSNVDSSQTDGLFTTIFNNFNSAATGGVDSITIPLPHNSGNIVLYSNVVSSHLGNLSSLVSAFWYFVFGLYAFKFVNNLLHSIKDGSILDGFKNNNEVITSDML